MKHTLLISAALASVFALSACNNKSTVDVPVSEITVPTGFTKIESVARKGNETIIPYNKYVLDNGLTVVLHTDVSDPLVHVDITYHVGSGREEPGKSGFAHFFEHMQFQGSDNVADEQHFSLITESGGTLNGSTNTDRTNYYETVPANQLERMLWLEADRMGFFLDAVTPEKFENQRETVKNERGQNYDNRPYGLLRERVNEALYPEGHPYSWLTIGYIEDLNRADLNDLKNFFLRWYGPNNATLTIGGDIDEQQTLEWIEKYFGGIPAGPAVDEPEYTKVTLSEDRYISMEDNVSLPLLYMAWPTVHGFHPDEAPLDVLMDILGSGKTSLLYKNMVKNGKAVQASAGHGCAELGCTFTLLALPTPGTSLAELETIARSSLEEFEQRGGANDDDITRVKAGIVSGMIYGLESVPGKVRQLAAYQTLQGNPNAIKDDIARYENVTKADVMRVYKKYIKGQHAVIMSIVPKGKADMIARADTWQRYERTIPKMSEGSELTLRPGTSNFDRSIIPSPGPNPTIKLPNIYKSELKNGMKIIGAINDEVPTTTIRIRIPAGQTREPLDKLGVAALTASMMNEATRMRSAEDLSNALNKIGSSVSFSSGDKYTVINLRTLTKNLDETIAIALERLIFPKFNQEDFDRIQRQTIEGIKNNKKDAGYTANMIENLLLYGRGNGFANPNSGTIETVKALTLTDVESFYVNNYGAKGADIIAVSDLGQTVLFKNLDSFSAFIGKVSEPKPMTTFPDIKAGTIYFIDKPESAQSEIRVAKRAIAYDATGEYFRAGIMNFPFGGAFNSRVNLNLREDKGYTYGARSYFDGSTPFKDFTTSAGVRSDVTAKSIIEFHKEINSYNKDGITVEELAFTKNARGQADARKYETPRQKLGFLSQIATYDLKPGFVEVQNDILATITMAEVNALAKKHLKLEDMITIVVGDKAKIMNSLKELGQPIVELDPEGNILK